ncbi:MAG: type II secretory ATPase GspE/PulE/Tfp pilus assembly ATPase PilB-like protein [Candidatus Azotimanducaceae bacterium]|jgi:type II secretory ATPase GspE/PulE/Tfp pilus assembly ATPase PilB-like protein
MSAAKKMRLGDRLVERGIVSQDQVVIALTEQKKTGKLIGNVLVELGFVSEAVMRDILGEILGQDSIELTTLVPDPDALALIDKQLATRHNVIPVSYDPKEKRLQLAMTDIFDVLVLDRIRANIPAGIDILPILAAEGEIKKALDQFYGYEMSVDGILREIETGELDYQSIGDSEEGEYSQPMVRLVDAMLADAVKREASDIHFEPESSFLRLRYRIDGVMEQIRSLHKDYWAAMVVRLKVMAKLNIAETRAPQGGRISLKVAGRDIDFRVSIQPSTHGENIVLRILDKAKGIVNLDDYKLDPETLSQLKILLSRPEGIILITGPTGSGKTTTLYSMLNYINSIEVNIMTLEDPVEYPMDLIRQTSIGEASKMDFATGIRSLMRQDPDVILVGEVRDSETAEMAFRAAMTGHQVFTTLHTNSALGAIPRLTNIGVKAEILAGNIIGIVGQRLVRTLCNNCKKARSSEEFEQIILGIEEAVTLYDPVGCEKCKGNGLKGRAIVIEVLTLNAELNEIIANQSTQGQLFQAAIKGGFKTMADDGVRLILEGRTTLEELSRVVDLTARLN